MSHSATHILCLTLLTLCLGKPLVAQDQNTGLSLDGYHYSYPCSEAPPVAPPLVQSQDQHHYELNYQDKIYQLGCTARGFTGYFALSQWESHARKGDDGVDVTGAPNSVLVEGANSASIILVPGSEASFGIVLPADGFISFDWRYIGGSPFYNQDFSVYVNDIAVERLSRDNMAGTYVSAGLEAGDKLRFEASAPDQGFEIRLSQFEFLTNATAVTARDWTATAPNGQTGTFTQLLALEKPDFSHLIFPHHRDGKAYPVVETPLDAEPDGTGYPAIDTDGDWTTTHDQLLLDKERFGLQPMWEDEMLTDGQQCIIYRHWTVRDLCGDNLQFATQVIIVQDGCPNNTKTWPPVQRTDQNRIYRHTQQPVTDPASISCNQAWKNPYHLPAEDTLFP